MKASVVITLYKDLQSLGLVLKALQRQTYKNFEVIVAEDDDAKETIEFLKYFDNLEIVHLSQADTGRNKVIIQNKAIGKASGEYLIFIDGDIVPFKHFVEYSLKIAEPKCILSGRRVNLNKELTAKVINEEIKIEDIENHYLQFCIKNRSDRNARVEQGIQVNPKGFIYKYILSKRKRNTEIIGCNFSCFKEDMIAINGFDEGYFETAVADDIDLTWRFKSAGYILKSSKNIANCFHLWHKFVETKAFESTSDFERFYKNKDANLFKCKDGVKRTLKLGS